MHDVFFQRASKARAACQREAEENASPEGPGVRQLRHEQALTRQRATKRTEKVVRSPSLATRQMPSTGPVELIGKVPPKSSSLRNPESTLRYHVSYGRPKLTLEPTRYADYGQACASGAIPSTP
jgi:hypothetical protein